PTLIVTAGAARTSLARGCRQNSRLAQDSTPCRPAVCAAVLRPTTALAVQSNRTEQQDLQPSNRPEPAGKTRRQSAGEDSQRDSAKTRSAPDALRGCRRRATPGSARSDANGGRGS